MQDRDETIQLPFTETSDIPVQMEVVDPSINKEASLAEEFPTAVDCE